MQCMITRKNTVEGNVNLGQINSARKAFQKFQGKLPLEKNNPQLQQMEHAGKRLDSLLDAYLANAAVSACSEVAAKLEKSGIRAEFKVEGKDSQIIYLSVGTRSGKRDVASTICISHGRFKQEGQIQVRELPLDELMRPQENSNGKSTRHLLDIQDVNLMLRMMVTETVAALEVIREFASGIAPPLKK